MTPPLGWAIAENTPFAYSQFHTPYGGTTNGTVIRWPKAITAKGVITALRPSRALGLSDMFWINM